MKQRNKTKKWLGNQWEIFRYTIKVSENERMYIYSRKFNGNGKWLNIKTWNIPIEQLKTLFCWLPKQTKFKIQCQFVITNINNQRVYMVFLAFLAHKYFSCITDCVKFKEICQASLIPKPDKSNGWLSRNAWKCIFFTPFFAIFGPIFS